MNKLVLSLLFCACASVPPPPPARVLCWVEADMRAEDRVTKECRAIDPAAGVTFAMCAAHDDIMEQLKKEQEACK